MNLRVHSKASEEEVLGGEADREMLNSLADVLNRFPENIQIRTEVSAAELTTFAVGGVVRNLIEVSTFDALRALVPMLYEHQISWKILGAGSNVVFPDHNFDPAVLRLGPALGKIAVASMPGEEIDIIDEMVNSTWEPNSVGDVLPGETVKIIAGGAASLMALSRKTAECGLSGLEFAAGIPASLGGAVAMNAGAHGSAMADVICEVLIVDRQGAWRVLRQDDLEFSYRFASLPAQSVVAGALLQLRKDTVAAVQETRKRAYEYRKRTQPLHLPSAGSVFKNLDPAQELQFHAGELLEKAGLKGSRRGGISYSELHANWLVKVGEEGSANDIKLLIAQGQQLVREKFQVELHPEIILW